MKVLTMREALLQGHIYLPDYDSIQSILGTDTDTTQNMLEAAWSNYIKNKGTISSTYWIEKFNTVKAFNTALKILSDNNWLIVSTTPDRHWSEISINENKLLQYLSPDELVHVRSTKKFLQYIPACKFKTSTNLTRINGKIRNTGLQRIGLAKSAQTQFYYDIDMLNKYQDTIIANTNKGMRKCRELIPNMVHDEASYDEVSTLIVQELSKTPVLMTMEGNVSDSRGRAIKGALSKVANPIGYKDFRALLTIPI